MMTNTIRSLGGGEDFHLQKKGRSLSQSSFLFSNFINVSRNYDSRQDKTLAFAPSYNQPREEVSHFSRDRPDWNRSSVIDHKPYNSHQSSHTNHRTPYTNRESSRSAKKTPVINYESSCVSCESSSSSASGTPSKSNLLFAEKETSTKVSAAASSYKYNPIFPGNQFSADDTQCGTSFTSLKNRILENIPLNLISNLDIFFNQTQEESGISSLSSFNRRSNSQSSRRRTVPHQKNSGSNDSLTENRFNKSNLEFLTCSPFSSYQWGPEKLGYRKNLGPKFSGIYPRFKDPAHLSGQSNLTRSQRTLRSSHYNPSCRSSSQQTEIVILKPAKESIVPSCSSEAIIPHLNEEVSSQETIQQSESHYGTEKNGSNGKDLRIHYLNDSANDESEYSLLASKGYTFTKRPKHDSSTSSSSTYVPETELRVVNFSEYSLEPPQHAPPRKEPPQHAPLRKEPEVIPKREYPKSSRGAFETTYESCHIVKSASSKGSSRHSKPKVNKSPVATLKEKQSFRQDKGVQVRSLAPPQPPRRRKEAATVLKKEPPRRVKNSTERISADQERTLKATVKKISNRFLRHEYSDTSDEESSTETIREEIPDRKRVTEAFTESISEESSDESESIISHRKNYEVTKASVVHQSPVQKSTSKMFQKRKRRSRTDFTIQQNQSHVRSKSSQKFVLNKSLKMKMRRRARYRHSVSSRSTLISSKCFSKCSVLTTDSANSRSYKTRRGKGKRSRTKHIESRAEPVQKHIPKTVKSRKTERKKLVEPERQYPGFREETSKNLVSRRRSKIFRRCRKNESSLNDKTVISSVDLKNSIKNVVSEQEECSFVESKKISLTKDMKEDKKSEHRTPHRSENIENSMTEKETIDSCSEVIRNAAESPKKVTKPEMDVYTRNDRKKFGIQGKSDITESKLSPGENTKVSNLEDKISAKLREICGRREEGPKKNKSPHIEGYVSVSDKENRESFYSFRKESSLTDITEQSKPECPNKDSPKTDTSESSTSLSSGIASSYFPNRTETIGDLSEDDIVDSTSEYIKWAKNCLLKQKTEPEDANSSGEESVTTTVDEDCSEATTMDTASDCVPSSRHRTGPVCPNHRCVTSCEEATEYSDFSFNLVASKSTLSVIMEENASMDRSPKDDLSQETSIAFQEPTSIAFQEPKRQRSNTTQNNSLGRPSEESVKVERRQSPRNGASDPGKSKSRNLSGLSSESERDLEQFKTRMKLIKKGLHPCVAPRVIPSSSTFAHE